MGLTRVQAYWAGRLRPTVQPRGMRSYEGHRFQLQLNGLSIAEIATRAWITSRQAAPSVSRAHRRLVETDPLLVCPTCHGVGQVPAPEAHGTTSSELRVASWS